MPVHARTCVRVCVCACVCAHECVCVHTHACMHGRLHRRAAAYISSFQRNEKLRACTCVLLLNHQRGKLESRQSEGLHVAGSKPGPVRVRLITRQVPLSCLLVHLLLQP